MVDLSRTADAFAWLYYQISLGWIAPAILGVLTLVILIASRRDRRVLWLLSLPVIWVAPIVLAAVFWDHEIGAKTAGWVGYAALAALLGQFIVTWIAVDKLRATRAVVIAAAVINALFGVFSAAVVGMASSGDWI